MEGNHVSGFFPGQSDDDQKINSKNLNEYIRVGSAGGYILIGALVLAVVALLIWGFTGTVPVTFTETGVIAGNSADTHSCLCFVDANENLGVIPTGKAVNIRMPDGRTFSGTMTSYSKMPYSAEELKKMFSESESAGQSGENFSDWVMEKLLDGCNYAYLMEIHTDEDVSDYWHMIVQATVVVGEVRPISLLRQ